MYHIERTILELNQPFEDAAHIIYVNGEYNGPDALGLLMHDFFCSNPAEMHYPELAKCADFFKHDNEGVSTMCEIMQNLQEEGRAEGREEERTSTAKKMLQFNEPIEKIAAYTSLSEERIKELAKQLN